MCETFSVLDGIADGGTPPTGKFCFFRSVDSFSRYPIAFHRHSIQIKMSLSVCRGIFDLHSEGSVASGKESTMSPETPTRCFIWGMETSHP